MEGHLRDIMATVDTYLFIGSNHLVGARAQSSQTETEAQLNPEAFWGLGRNYPKMQRVVPSDATGVTGGVYNAYWDGQFGGTGQFVPFHYMDNTVIPGAKGDSWFQFGGGITAVNLLMQSLFDQYGNQDPGFRMIKQGAAGGVATWLNGNPGRTVLDNTFAAAQADETARTTRDLLVKAVVIDTSDDDINLNGVSGPNIAYQANLTTLIAELRAKFGQDLLVVIVNANPFTYKTSFPPIAPLIRAANAEIAKADENVRLYDMSWGQFQPDTKGSPVESDDPVYFDPETYLQAGAGIYAVIRSHFTQTQITADATGPLAGVAVIGDSQLVTLPSNPLSVFYGDQASLLGSDPLTTLMDNVWIYDDNLEEVVPYDGISNAHTFSLTGPTGNFGPEWTMARSLVAQYPGGILLYKYAQAGMSLTVEAVAAGATGSLLGASGAWETAIKPKFSKVREIVATKFNRSLDMIGMAFSIGENDLLTDDSLTAFVAQVDSWIAEAQEFFRTNLAPNYALPAVWIQGSPPFSENAKGNVLGDATRRNTYRATVESVSANRPGLRFLANTGQYELRREDQTHYGLEAVLQIGEDFATNLLAEIGLQESGTDDATVETTGLNPSDSAAFIVETGSGTSDANTWVTVEEADAILVLYGSPREWFNANDAAKKNALRQMARHLSLDYKYQGVRSYSDQGLAHPRSGMIDDDGYDVDSTSIHRRMKEAQVVGAWKILAGTFNPFPDLTTGTGASGFSISIGSFSISENSSGGELRTAEGRVSEVVKLISPFLENGSQGGPTVSGLLLRG